VLAEGLVRAGVGSRVVAGIQGRDRVGAVIEILAGVAGTQKTAWLLDEYRAALRRGRETLQPGRTLWICPTDRARRYLRSHLLGTELSACFAPNLFTFERFAERILEFSTQRISPLSPAMQRILLRRLVDAERRRGGLKYFSPIAHTSGFLDLVLSLISELKRDETWPEEFEAACKARGVRPSDRELARLYTAYQNELLRHSWYDAQGRFWSAREQLERGEWGPFDSFELVVIDGFTDFTYTQYEILSLLSRRAERMLITLPLETPLVRRDLFAKTESALERLKRLNDGAVKVTSMDGETPATQAAESRPAGFRQIATQLFANPRSIPLSSEADGLELIAAAGPLGEVRSIAARIKSLLLGGVSADDIIVAFRSPDDYADLVEEVFTAAGIPYSADGGRPLGRSPLVRTLLSALQLEIEDWPFERLLAVLRSSLMRPRWREWSAGSRRMVARELRRLKLHLGRETILSTLEREATRGDGSEPTADITETSNPAADSASSPAASALGLLKQLSHTLARVRQPASFGSWAEIVVSLARELGIAPGPKRSADDDDPHIAEERRVWETFEGLLFSAAQTVEQLEESPATLTLSDFYRELADLVYSQVTNIPTPPGPRVQVLDAAQVRSLKMPYLFLGGLTESSFPRRQGEDCVYGETERRELNEHGLALGHHASRTQEEMLLFYGVVTSPQKLLVLSYPAMTTNGQPLSPSPYLTALVELFEPDALPVQREESLDPVPAVEAVQNVADLRVIATAEALAGRPQLFRTLAGREEGVAAARGVIAAGEMAVARFHTRGFTSYEGIMRHPANRAALAERFSPEREFSATQLEAYAQCPFRFWVSRVLDVQPLEPPEIATDFRRRGILVHEILAELHQELRDVLDVSMLGDAADDSSRQVVDRFHHLLRQKLERIVPASELQKALLAVEQRLLSRWGTAYAEQWLEYNTQNREKAGVTLAPSLFEIIFGTPAKDDPTPPEKIYRPLVLGNGENETRINGRIDRIDVGETEGATLFNIIDYKTGKPPKFSLDDIRSGRTLQLVLYALAVERLEIVGPAAKPFQPGYWSIQETGFSACLKSSSKKTCQNLDDPDWDAACQSLEELVPRLAAAIRGGAFPVYNQQETCTGYCDYKTACRVNQIRPLEEALDKRWQV